MTIFFSLCRLFAILLFLELFPILCEAQELSAKIAIEIDDEAVEDMTGRNFVYYIKEGIRKSSEMRLTVSDEIRIQVKISGTAANKRVYDAHICEGEY